MLLESLSATLLIVIIISLRLVFLVWKIHKERQTKRTVGTGQSELENASIMVVLGSGGHTKEMITFLEVVGKRFSPRYYVVAETDKFSIEKLTRLQQQRNDENHEIYKIPRSREVRQSYLSAVLTTIKAFICTVPIVMQKKPDILLCNGPGTCIPVCIACFLSRVFFVSNTKLVYVESICRVTTLSLSGKLLYNFADSFIVQWPDLVSKFPKANYIGRLM